MSHRFGDKLKALDLEEKILNVAVVLAIAGMFFPWIGGRWLGDTVRNHWGFGYYTSFIGLAIFILLLYVLLITLVPLISGRVIVRKRYKEQIRLNCTAAASILTLAALSVLTQVTLTDFQGMEVRYGIYITLAGCLVATLYAFLRLQEQKRSQAQELFHHPEDSKPKESKEEVVAPPPEPPPPPPPPDPEDHRMSIGS